MNCASTWLNRDSGNQSEASPVFPPDTARSTRSVATEARRSHSKTDWPNVRPIDSTVGRMLELGPFASLGAEGADSCCETALPTVDAAAGALNFCGFCSAASHALQHDAIK